ncbi:ATP-binding protein [Actinomycetota bacterium Odt1-20B]
MPETDEVTHQLPRTPRSAPHARALLREQLAAWKIDGQVVDVAELLLSELVTNSIQHAYIPAGREIGLRFARYEGKVRVEVADAGGGRPVPVQAGVESDGGRGLALVVALASRWGCCPRRHGIGKAVWAEVEEREGV